MLNGAMPRPVVNRLEQFERIIPELPPGDIAELGVYNGGSTLQLASFGRDVWAFDTFEGMPHRGYIPAFDTDNPPGKWIPTEYFEMERVIKIKGEFIDTLPVFPSTIEFAFAYIDCDNYNSYIMSLWFVASRIVGGGCFICDDWSCAGARLAMQEFLKIAPHWKMIDDSLFIR